MTSSAKRSRTKKAAPSGISSVGQSSSPLWGVYVLIDCWKRKRQHDAEEREAQRQELQAKGLLDFDEPADEADTEPAGDDFWTEDGDAEATPEGDASSDETDA